MRFAHSPKKAIKLSECIRMRTARALLRRRTFSDASSFHFSMPVATACLRIWSTNRRALLNSLCLSATVCCHVAKNLNASNLRQRLRILIATLVRTA
eukprot:593590-Rhodomonas_salina.4